MRIAVCDDSLDDLHEILELLEQYDSNRTHEVCSFSAAADLYKSNAERSFDIAILDIEMESPNGYDIAKQLKKESDHPLIIFATNSMAYTIRGYGIAFRYLAKPVCSEDFQIALDAAVQEITANHFSYITDGKTLSLRTSDIFYFEVYGHFTTVHTADEQHTIRITLKEIQAQLPKGYFAAPHQSYIVNLAHIRTATSNEIKLTNGACIPVSRRRQRDFEHQFHQYLGR